MYSVTQHERFPIVCDAKATAYNNLVETLVENGLEKEISKVKAFQEAFEVLAALYEEVAYDNGTLKGMGIFVNFIEKNITIEKRGQYVESKKHS